MKILKLTVIIALAGEFLGLCDELTALLKTRKEFSLCDWIGDARSWGKNPPEKDYYEMAADTENYFARIYADAPDASYENNPTAVEYSEREVSSKDVLDLRLATSGGCAIRFIKR